MGINCQITLRSGNSVTNSAEDNIKRFEGVLPGHQVGESAQEWRGTSRRIISMYLRPKKERKIGNALKDKLLTVTNFTVSFANIFPSAVSLAWEGSFWATAREHAYVRLVIYRPISTSLIVLEREGESK